MKRLSDEQLATFDTDFVKYHVGWEKIINSLKIKFPSGVFSFLDVGGGNGVFADRLLTAFPKSHGAVLDNARYLLDKNIDNERKSLIECSVENMCYHFNDERFDLIFFNWVLHHFVENSYKGSINTISNALQSGKQLLSANGLISIIENCYLPFWTESLPSKIIYHSLSSKSLSFVTKQLGANTSGTGVCYLSESLWCSMLEDASLKVMACESMGSLRTNLLKKIVCQIKGIKVVHILARK